MKDFKKSVRLLKRLKRTIEEVRDTPCKGFNWHLWVDKTVDVDMKKEVAQENGYDEEHFCGTQACVAGWAGIDPYFRRLGLRTVAKDARVYITEDNSVLGKITNRVDRLSLAGFFHLNSEQAGAIFYAEGNLGWFDSIHSEVDIAIDVIGKVIAEQEALATVPGAC